MSHMHKLIKVQVANVLRVKNKILQSLNMHIDNTGKTYCCKKGYRIVFIASMSIKFNWVGARPLTHLTHQLLFI